MSTSLKPRRGTRRDGKPPVHRADLPVSVLDDAVLYWPVCGHAEDDDVVLYDRPVCIACED